MAAVPFITLALVSGRTQVIQKSQVVSVDQDPDVVDRCTVRMVDGQSFKVVGSVATTTAALNIEEA